MKFRKTAGPSGSGLHFERITQMALLRLDCKEGKIRSRETGRRLLQPSRQQGMRVWIKVVTAVVRVFLMYFKISMDFIINYM